MIYPMIDAHAIQSTYLLYIAAEAEITLRSGPLARPGIGIIGIFRIPPPYRTHYSSTFITLYLAPTSHHSLGHYATSL